MSIQNLLFPLFRHLPARAATWLRNPWGLGCLGLLGLTLLPACTVINHRQPSPSASALPRWRGFNLLEKFGLEWSNEPFRESDFAMISELGFNFVRLPLDYRVWIVDGDWDVFDEAVLQEIDQAVEWGRQYNLHVSLNFHRAPGYTVAAPPEKTDLWSDVAAQQAFVRHWRMFARRYRGIPSHRLSFNLLNEPTAVAQATYARVMALATAAIRQEDPDRLIICDGLDHGRIPVAELAALEVAQATRGYEPFALTHYQATWIGDTSWMPFPSWPQNTPSGYLYGPGRAGLHRPLVVEGPFEQEKTLRLHLHQVSGTATWRVEADGELIFQENLQPGPGQGDWQEVVHNQEWEIYQNIYNRDYFIQIPAGTATLAILVGEGDWLLLSEIGIAGAEEQERLLALDHDWGQMPPRIQYQADTPEPAFMGQDQKDRAWLWRETIAPWQKLEADGVGVMVGEWGAFNKTPHDVLLAWAEDCLQNWRSAGWGWALWNFRGPFGILDSERPDVEYEDFHGHQLDRQFLELLQRY